MGGQNSTGESRNKDFLLDLKENFILEKDINDRRFGPSQLYKSKKNPLNMVLGITKLLNSENQLNEFQRELTIRRQHDHKSLLKIKGLKKDSGDGFCGSSNKFIIFMEYYDHDLGLEIERRSIHKEYLTESEVWYLCDAIISVSAYLEENEIYHGDIRPCNILLSEEGFAKIFDHGVLNDLRSGYIKMLAGSDRCYLSPDLLLSFAKREFQPTYNVHKADVFSFGMSLLYATTLSDPFYCYDFLAYKIVKKNKEELLNKTNSRYSLLLTDFIRKMLEEDEKVRPTFRELYSMLIPHQESIRQMQSMVDLRDNSQLLVQSNSQIFGSEPNSVMSNMLPHIIQSPQAGHYPMSSPTRQITAQNYIPQQPMIHQQFILKEQGDPMLNKFADGSQLVQSSFFSDSLINRSMIPENKNVMNYVQMVPQQMVAQQAVPQQVVSQQVVPQQMISQQIVPQQIVFSNNYEFIKPLNNTVTMAEFKDMQAYSAPGVQLNYTMPENLFILKNEEFGRSFDLQKPFDSFEIQRGTETSYELNFEKNRQLTPLTEIPASSSNRENSFSKEVPYSLNNNPSSQSHPYGILNFNEKSEIDRKVLEAIRNTEDTILRNAKVPITRDQI